MSDIQESLDSLTQILKAGDIVHISLRMLGCINKNITFHSIRTAYLAWKLGETIKDEKLNLQNLVILSLYHTLGFFRVDDHTDYNPHDTNIDFFSETKEVSGKYVFSCYYLKYMTPLGEAARALENFTQPYNDVMKHFIYQERYKSIIYLCARISEYLYHHGDIEVPEDIDSIAPGYFDPEYVRAFKIANKNNCLVHETKDDKFIDEFSVYIDSFSFEPEESKMYEKLLIYFLDFKSTFTVSHAINTSCYALSLGKRMGLSPAKLSELYYSAVLHDIGKIATPQRILEFPGKLSPEDMGIMRHHVNHSKRILSGHAPEQIIENVYRHHEKLNGKGYPRHLEGKDLNLLQRILTVADITSALNDSRSYKSEFSTDKTLSIIKKMTDDGELDPLISIYIEEDFASIVEEQQYLYKILCVDFSQVLVNYSNYLLSDMSRIADAALSEDSEAVDDLEDLEEL